VIALKIITLFPEFFDGPLRAGLMGKAIESGIIALEVMDLRDFSEDRLRRCDDYPYGGGSGMVLTPGPLFRAIRAARTPRTRVILTTPAGRLLTQDLVKELSGEAELCIVCGRYEGVDQRVIDRCIDDEISVGDYVLSGGEYAALIIADAVARYVPGFMGNAESLVDESFADGLLEYPQYTRPAEYEGMQVPEVLLSGHHGNVAAWRRDQRIEKTRRLRPDVYSNYLMRNNRGNDHGSHQGD